MKNQNQEILSDQESINALSDKLEERLQTLNADITPTGSLEVLSHHEIERLLDASQGGLYQLFRRCTLAVLNCGSPVDDSKIIMEQFKNFNLRVLQEKEGFGWN